MTKRVLLAGLLFLAVFAAASCGKTDERKNPDKVTVQLKWLHQAQFAGFYVARERGYYAAENLDVSFIEGGPKVDLSQSVISGQAGFGVMSPEDVLIQCAKGAPLVAIAAIYRHSAVVYVSKKASNIIYPKDMEGKKIAAAGQSGSIRDFEFQLHAMEKKLGLDVSKIEIVPYDPEYKKFLNNEVELTAAYLTGGVAKLKEKGVDLNIIWPGDYGIWFYSDTLVTSDRLIKTRPDLVLRFLRATLRGWRDAVGDPPQAVRDTLKYVQNGDPRLQLDMMEAQMPLIHTGEDYIGWMKRDEWLNMGNILFEQGLLPGPLDVDRVFTTKFLAEIYGGTPK